jgi:hypothetical protein
MDIHRLTEIYGKGLAPVEILAEYRGKAAPPSRGRLGQHLLNPEIEAEPGWESA